MTRHLADPDVGAVSAYIREGSEDRNYLTKFIGVEYVLSQPAARRAQNVLGAQACLAGGAQLHTRENLIAIGGRIDTSSLAEDTITTFETQLQRQEGRVRAARRGAGGGAARGRRTVEAAPALGARQRDRHGPLQQGVVPSVADAQLGRRGHSASCGSASGCCRSS